MKKLLPLLLLTLLALTTTAYGLDIDLDANTAVDIEYGGTNSTTAAAARTALGLAIGTNVQAYDADLTTYGSITPSADVQSVLGAADYTAIRSLLSVTSPAYSAWTILYNNGSGSITELPLGVTGTALISSGINSAPYFGAVAGSGGGTIGGSLGSTDNVILRSDGTGGVTAQGSTVTISDTGTVNIPTGQTYQIDGVAHVHNYQPLTTNLTTYGTITPSANVQSLMGAANYSAMRTLLNVVPGTDVQAYSAALAAIAGVTPARGDMLYYGPSGWTNIAKGTLAQVLTQGASDPLWSDNTSSGISRWDQLQTPTTNLTLAQGAYKSIFTSTNDTLGSIWTLTNTTVSHSFEDSFIDFKLDANGDANAFYLRGYDNSGGDLKWSIGNEGAFKGYSFETDQALTGGTIAFLEGSGGGTNKITVKAPDTLAADYQIDLPAASGTIVLEGISTGGVLLGDATPDAAGELGYASTQLIFHDGTAARNVAKAGTLTNTKWCSSDGTVINCTEAAPAGGGDFLADGTVPLTGSIIGTVAGASNLGSATAELGNIFLGDGKIIYGQADQSATLTSSAGKWTANVFAVTGALTAASLNGHTFTAGSSTFTGTAAQTYTFPTTSATLARIDAANTFTGVQTMTSPALTTPVVTTDIHAATAGGATLGTALLPFSSVYLGNAATNNFLITGTSAAARTVNIPDIAATGYIPLTDATTTTAGKIPLSTTTAGKYTHSTPTYPSASGTARKMLVSDGTNNVYSTELWPVATTSGNIMVADGTNWVTTATVGTGAPLKATVPTIVTPKIGNTTTSAGYIDLLEDSDNGTDYVRIAGKNDSGTSGSFTFSSSVASSESITLALGANDNTATISSATGVTDLSFSALNLVTTGAIHGGIEIISDDTSLSAAQCYGSFNDTNGTETITLPAAVAGMNLCIYSNDATVKTIDPNGTDVIELNGTALTAGYAIKSPGAAGNFICLISRAVNTWTTLGQSGVWVTNGS